jgi:membrane-bound lytic murein transglycosylase MltF
VPTVRKGTATGNILFKRYYADNRWMRNPAASEDYARFQATADVFRQYGDQYGFDWLMLAAQGYQESRIDQSVRSPAGAVGIMQLLPSTAADPSVGIQDIHEVENNIHAGARYLRFLVRQYLDDPAMDDFNRTLFAFAAYNAGPGNLQKIRHATAALGLDPNVWFGNAEIGAAKVIGRETPTYVANIAKYYYAYRLIEERRRTVDSGD